jgi:hypothetical protein
MSSPYHFKYEYDSMRMLLCVSSIKHDVDGRIPYRQAVKAAIHRFHPLHAELLDAIRRVRRLCQ